ncbi:MAG TPA: bL28 family ribosomal protein [Patescibacteria group bacterium]
MKSTIKGRLECAICGKGVQTSNLVSFSKRRIKHVRKPNLHSHKMEVEGTKIKIKVCTSCKRALRLAERNAAQKQLTASAK